MNAGCGAGMATEPHRAEWQNEAEFLIQRRQSREVCTQAGAVWEELGNRGFPLLIH